MLLTKETNPIYEVRVVIYSVQFNLAQAHKFRGPSEN